MKTMTQGMGSGLRTMHRCRPQTAGKTDRLKGRGLDTPEKLAQYRQERQEAWDNLDPRRKAEIQRKIDAAQAAARNQVVAPSQRLLDEAKKRGITLPANATRDDLIRLLNENPARSQFVQGANKFNKFNGGALLIRTGLLFALKTNRMKITERVVWGMFSSYAAARQAGFTGSEALYQNRVIVWKRLQEIHFAAGGNLEKLRDAILKAKNTPNQVGLDPATASVLAAATAALVTLAKQLKAGDEGKPISDAEVLVADAAISGRTPAPGSTLPATTTTTTITNSTPGTAEKSFWAQHKKWAQPVLVVGLLGGAGYGGYRYYKKKKASDQTGAVELIQ